MTAEPIIDVIKMVPIAVTAIILGYVLIDRAAFIISEYMEYEHKMDVERIRRDMIRELIRDPRKVDPILTDFALRFRGDNRSAGDQILKMAYEKRREQMTRLSKKKRKAKKKPRGKK